MVIRAARVYDEPAPGEGRRVLVDRLWPRGIRKEEARWDIWAKEVAPSTELRTWFGHDPARFSEFAARYEAELARPDAAARLKELRALGEGPGLLLLTAARDLEHSQAVVLKGILER